MNFTALSCRVSTTFVFATYLTGTTVACVTPPGAAGAASLYVANDGVNIGSAGTFTYNSTLLFVIYVVWLLVCVDMSSCLYV